jgi:hypothetical protein
LTVTSLHLDYNRQLDEKGRVGIFATIRAKWDQRDGFPAVVRETAKRSVNSELGCLPRNQKPAHRLLTCRMKSPRLKLKRPPLCCVQGFLFSLQTFHKCNRFWRVRVDLEDLK